MRHCSLAYDEISEIGCDDEGICYDVMSCDSLLKSKWDSVQHRVRACEVATYSVLISQCITRF